MSDDFIDLTGDGDDLEDFLVEAMQLPAEDDDSAQTDDSESAVLQGDSPLGGVPTRVTPDADPLGQPPVSNKPTSMATATEQTTPESATEPGADVESEEEEGKGRRRRRRYDPFKDFDPVQSSEAALQAREMTTLSELKRIKKARVRHEGQRVVTDNVRKLKSLSIEPHLPPGEYINYYVEPVKIEYYIPRDSRFVTENRFLYIPLIDPIPREQDTILKDHMSRQAFVDIIKLMNEYPMYITALLETYNDTMNLYENLSRSISEAEAGNSAMYRQAFYLVEALSEYEPTIAALDFLGEFHSYKLNLLVRRMNTLAMDVSAADKTISYFIKKRNVYWEENGLDYDERFEILAALFYEQAFPNRGLQYEDEDFFGDIFDRKFEI